ncbi:MAG: DoxX family protein, partial [Stackebrandtia sp.]
VRGMTAGGMPADIAAAYIENFARDFGPAATVTGDVDRALGRPATDYATWVADHAVEFRGLPAGGSAMNTTYLVVVSITAALNLISGAISVLATKVIQPRMAAVNVPKSWLAFPIGTLKLAGGLGLIAGLWLPWLGTAAAIGLVLFYVCAVHTHLLVRHYALPFPLAILYLGFAVATLTLDLLG